MSQLRDAEHANSGPCEHSFSLSSSILNGHDKYSSHSNFSLPWQQLSKFNLFTFCLTGNLFTRTTTPNYCKRHAMTINFDRSLGDTNPYIAPSSFEAYHCSGECPFPIPNHMDPTMHAVVQRIMNSVDSKWPPPCCVPTKLRPMKVLYLDENELVKVKIMKKMIAEKCGCR